MLDLGSLTAVILAGGFGTRLRSMVADRPKVLAEVGGRPFITYLLDQLAAAGIRHVVLCTGHLGTQVQELLQGRYHNLDLVHSQEPLPLGTAGALRLALPLFNSDPVLVMNGDSYCEADLMAFWAWHHARSAEATLLLTAMADTGRYGLVQVDADGRILSFAEKQEKGQPGWINAGVYVIHRCLIDTIPSMRPVSLEQEMFPAWIEYGLYGCRSNGCFVDIGTPDSYAMAEEFFAPTGVGTRQEQLQ